MKTIVILTLVVCAATGLYSASAEPEDRRGAPSASAARTEEAWAISTSGQ